MHDIATVLSLGLTIVYLQYVWRILNEWWPSTKDALRDKGEWTGSQWLIAGIFTGFLAGFGDNIVWGVLWLMDYIGIEDGEFALGVYFNVVLRQTLGIISAYAHIRSILLYLDTSTTVDHIRIWALGAAGAAILIVVKYCLMEGAQ